MGRLEALDAFAVSAHIISWNGDYLIGKVVMSMNDYVIIDFVGEPARPVADRRAKTSPLKDGAGMIRSFSYAAYAGLFNYGNRRPGDLIRLQGCARLWESQASSAFLNHYMETAEGAAFLPAEPSEFKRLLDVFVMEKTLYELRYELSNRPAWARIPLQSLLDLISNP
jgi:maltose alpha-D-glucosyltransferase/alpha-amylase